MYVKNIKLVQHSSINQYNCHISRIKEKSPMIHLNRCRKSPEKISRKATNWEKIFTTRVSEKGLVSRTTLSLLNYKKQNNLVIFLERSSGREGGKRLRRNSTKENLWMTNKYNEEVLKISHQVNINQNYEELPHFQGHS